MATDTLARDEQETCLTWGRPDELVDATVYSRRLIAQIRRLGDYGRQVDGGAMHCRFPADRLKLRLPRKQRRKAASLPDLRGFGAGDEELAVTFNESDRTATVYTTSARWARPLCRQGVPWTRDGWGVRFLIPRAAVKVFPRRQVAQRQLELMAAGRERQREETVR